MGQLASGAFDGSGTGVFPGSPEVRTVVAKYDFDVHGGAEGDIVIGTLPSGSVILGGHMVVGDPVTGAGASVAITVEGAGDVVAAAAISGAPWSTTGKKAIIPKRNTPETTSVTLTAARNILAVVSGAPVTAGVFTLFLEVRGGA
jgi:hypothetical protein